MKVSVRQSRMKLGEKFKGNNCARLRTNNGILIEIDVKTFSFEGVLTIYIHRHCYWQDDFHGMKSCLINADISALLRHRRGRAEKDRSREFAKSSRKGERKR